MTTNIFQMLSTPVLVSIALLIQQQVTIADDYLHLKSVPHEVSSATGVEYTLVPVISLAFVDRSGFIFQRYTNGNGNLGQRLMGQYSLKKEKESNGDYVLRIFNRGKQTEYGVLLPVDDDDLGKVLVYTAKKQVEGKEVDYTLVFKRDLPGRSTKTFLDTFLAGIEKPDQEAMKRMLDDLVR